MAAPLLTARQAGLAEMHPLLKDKLLKPRTTVFFPGGRIKMNVLPMLANFFVPVAVFFFVCALCSSSAMYQRPSTVYSVLVLAFLIWLLLIKKAVQARRNNPDPTWYSYVAVVVGLALLAGTHFGFSIYENFKEPYFHIRGLKLVRELDPNKEHGENWMDAGILEFKEGSHLSSSLSWHFKHHRLYCVSPIVVNSSMPQTQSYDFWAVGQDCCSATSSDFRCGAWSVPGIKTAIRVIDNEAAEFYHLAVQQAASLYGITAKHPIFVRWAAHPQSEVIGWDRTATRNLLLLVCAASVTSLFLLTLATCRFAFIGRAGRQQYLGENLYANGNGPASFMSSVFGGGGPYPATDPRTGLPMNPSLGPNLGPGLGIGNDPGMQRYV